MASIIIFATVFGVSAIGYSVFSAVKAHRNKRKQTKYQQKVNEFTVKRGYPLQSNYDDLEKRLANGEELKAERNPMDNVVYREIKEINDKLVSENQNRVPLYRQRESHYQEV
tara:strand:- start:2196 stop:2531 length:336 start_codon:yes stop_codon:yes gene_type:complete